MATYLGVGLVEGIHGSIEDRNGSFFTMEQMDRE